MSHTQTERYALRRLHIDWKELEEEKENLTTVAALPTSNMFIWHCNLRPDYGPYAGTIFHLILQFPKTYPNSPPAVELGSSLPNHPNVFDDNLEDPNWRTVCPSSLWICLDLLKQRYVSTPYAGWTSAYSILSVILQLQSFLFAENIPQDWGGYQSVSASRSLMDKAVRDAESFRFGIEPHDGGVVEHTHENPWPPLPKYVGETGYQVRGRRKSQTMHVTSPSVRPQISSERQQLEPLKLAIDSEEVPVLGSEAPESTTISKMSTLTTALPPDVQSSIFTFLGPKELLRVRDVCSHWRKVLFTYNLFERSQIMCYHSKVKLDDKDAVLGFGLKVEYYPGGNALKAVSSPLDLLSMEAFEGEGVRTGVWRGDQERFDYFLPLIFSTNSGQG
ncbi:enzyme E2 2 [Seminavis robusta]|uniref:Enzyme E2 2 n=1 Tax=Seminavis robusta TaxID=568900 RepID=A0A9N8DNA8_9STRA|nr:enzyme E2 2 [Seminavis robusta]|eukprot:Sro222_g091210.1 enzyme E2 2 (390) ;mRNA; f:64067-65236